jgi:hypothetical protein
MSRRQHQEGVSHDPKDAPMFTHRVFEVFYPMLKSKVIAIQDDDRTHYPFLKQWVGMEIDIDCQWSINNGTLGLDLSLHNAGKHRFEYCVKLKTVQAIQILKTPHHFMGIINEQKRLIYGFKPLQVNQLAEFVGFKKKIDDYVKHEHLYPKGWSVE